MVPIFRERGSKKKKLEVLAVNRFDEQKNPELLVDIARRIKASAFRDQINIVVIGEGRKYKWCKNVIEEEGLSDIIELFGSTTDTRAFMREADIFLSTSRWEGMPIALLEAMSEGLPIVATRVIGNVDVVTDCVEGFLFDPACGDSAVEAIARFLCDDVRLRCARHGYESVKSKYSAEVMARKTLAIYRNCYIPRD